MPPLREMRLRMRSIKNLSQVTRALEAVSASKARKAQQVRKEFRDQKVIRETRAMPAPEVQAEQMDQTHS